MAARKKGLGRGLDGMFTSYKETTDDVTPKTTPKESSKTSSKATEKKKTTEKKKVTEKKEESQPLKADDESVVFVKMSQVEPNREQPRKDFNEEGLEELAESIRQFGVIQPLLVQKRDDYLEIIAGERRWRAARLAGLKEIPVIIKDYSEQEIVEVSLIENIQREDLNPIEEARAYQRLLQEFDLKQEDVAQRVSKNRTTITNSLRLLKLNTKVQDMLAEGTISSGHARALLGIEDPDAQLEIANRVVEEKLSVRDIERLMRTLASGRPQKKEKEKDLAFELACRDMEEKMKATLGTKVTVNFRSKNKGRIEIEYYSQDELERLYELLRSLGR